VSRFPRFVRLGDNDVVLVQEALHCKPLWATPGGASAAGRVARRRAAEWRIPGR
jgi:hypothetical protein